MTADITELRKLLAAAKGDGGYPRLFLSEYQDRPFITYSDGDGCADVYGNIALGFQEEEIAALIVAAVNGLPGFIDRIERVETSLRNLDRLWSGLPEAATEYASGFQRGLEAAGLLFQEEIEAITRSTP